jgi:NAD(P)-dependent dehydrogenase (short-subunit alcohol dehydrogenase family)
VSAPVAVIVGAGGVLGGALREELSAAGWLVTGVRRSGATTPFAYAADLANPEAAGRIVRTIEEEHGPIDALIYNAAELKIAPFLELDFADFDSAWRASVGGAVAWCRAVLPSMLRRNRGSIICTGATGSTRGSARFTAFAAAKFGLRGLCQALAREYQAAGIHVAQVILDGLLAGSPSVTRFGGDPERTLDPREVAKTYRWLIEQPSTAWTHEVDLRHRDGRF